MLKMPKATIDRHIRLGLVKKLDIWIPQELKEMHLTKRIKACDLHLNGSWQFSVPDEIWSFSCP